MEMISLPAPLLLRLDLWKSDPGFADYAHGDFTIRKDAPVLRKIPGLEKIPFRNIGLR